jgi:hypothetical protein
MGNYIVLRYISETAISKISTAEIQRSLIGAGTEVFGSIVACLGGPSGKSIHSPTERVGSASEQKVGCLWSS